LSICETEERKLAYKFVISSNINGTDRISKILSKYGYSKAGAGDFKNSQDNLGIVYSRRARSTSDLYMVVDASDPILSEIKSAIKLDRIDAKKKRVATPPKPVITFMLDIIGSPIYLGDWIAFTSCNEMQIGEVIKFTEKTMTVKINSAE
jgi:hypothetical protein